MNHILKTGQVDDWKDDMVPPGLRVDEKGTRLVYEDAYNAVDASRKSLLRTVGQQGQEIEVLITDNEDLKSEINQLANDLKGRRWLNILFGSVVLILLVAVII